jgi:SAM-dependent methyltransferase
MTTAQPKNDDYDYRFKPRDYLTYYFSTVDNTNETILKFFAQVAKTHEVTATKILDLGCGPSIDAAISFAPACAEIQMADYLEENLREIQRWVEKDPDAFNWEHFLQRSLRLESELSNHVIDISDEMVAERAEIVRRKMTHFVTGDVRNQLPLGATATESYDILIISFCLEAVAKDLTEWQQLVRNVFTLLKRKGLLVWIMTAGKTDAYQVKDEIFPITRITQQDIEDALRNLIIAGTLQIDCFEVTEHELIQSVCMVTARKF